MEVSFETADLAVLCNSQRRMAERWGPKTSRTVGRRLIDLAASTATTIERIPDASIETRSDGKTTITFADAVVVRGVLQASAPRVDKTAADADCFVISSVEVKERYAR